MRINRLTAAIAAYLVSILATASAFAAASPATKAAPAPSAARPAAPPAASPATERAIFAGGCFWCEETAFEGLPGVQSVISGYIGGTKLNPTYEEVSAGGTGHAESVEITYDPKKISYSELLDLFWHNTDPTQSNGQFCDIGNQYRSEIFYTTPGQKQLAEESKRKLETTPQRFKGKIVTPIVAATKFYPAEEYHQDFYRKDPERYQSYREGCGRDRRLTQLWGKPGRQGHAEAESAAAH
jgi:peptide-methionine (S)-S-oxide reductase